MNCLSPPNNNLRDFKDFNYLMAFGVFFFSWIRITKVLRRMNSNREVKMGRWKYFFKLNPKFFFLTVGNAKNSFTVAHEKKTSLFKSKTFSINIFLFNPERNLWKSPNLFFLYVTWQWTKHTHGIFQIYFPAKNLRLIKSQKVQDDHHALRYRSQNILKHTRRNNFTSLALSLFLRWNIKTCKEHTLARERRNNDDDDYFDCWYRW